MNFLDQCRNKIRRLLHELAVEAARRQTPTEALELARWRKAIEEFTDVPGLQQIDRPRGSPLTPEGVRDTRDTVVGYRIESGPEPILCEYRSGNGQPFRCPKSIYITTAEVMEAAASNGLLFRELHDLLNIHARYPQPDYLPRICLRFWQRWDPPLIWRRKGRYGPITSAPFTSAASNVWDTLAASGFRPVTQDRTGAMS